jgi:hypothetical protein
VPRSLSLQQGAGAWWNPWHSRDVAGGPVNRIRFTLQGAKMNGILPAA